LEILSEPLVHVSRDGMVRGANRAFLALAEHCGTGPDLGRMFGPALADLLGRARDGGPKRALLAVAHGPKPRPWYQLLLHASPAGDGLYVVLLEASDEMSWRRERLQRDRG